MELGLVLITVLLSLFLLPDHSGAQDQDAKSSDEQVAVAVLKKSDDNAEYSASFDVGTLPVGKQVVLNLKIQNPYDEEIQFTGVSKKCACSQFKPAKYLFLPKDEITASLRLKVPARKDKPVATSTVVLVRSGIPVARLHLNYKLEGLLAFSEILGIIKFDSDQQSKTIEIPFLATSPVEAKDVQVKTTDNLSAIDWEIAPGDQGGVLRATVTDSILKQGRIRGEVYLVHPKTGAQDAYFLTIKDAKLGEISPDVIRFQRIGNRLQARATLRVSNSNSGHESQETAGGRSVQVSCTHSGNPLKVKLKKLSDDLFRVQLDADDKRQAALLDAQRQADSKSNLLVWQVIDGKLTTKLITPFVIEKAN